MNLGSFDAKALRRQPTKPQAPALPSALAIAVFFAGAMAAAAGFAS